MTLHLMTPYVDPFQRSLCPKNVFCLPDIRPQASGPGKGFVYWKAFSLMSSVLVVMKVFGWLGAFLVMANAAAAALF